jgi:N-acetylglucosaminyldiphosphoundecaprenol N-acetyl-beta-D-mannosaminyltransferase
MEANIQAVAIEEVLVARSIHRSSTTLDSLDVTHRLKSHNADLSANQEETCHSPPVPCSLATLPISSLWGLDFHCVDMQQTLQCIEQIVRERRPTFAVTANLNYAMLCAQHARLKEFTRKAALVLCDGMPILWRSKFNKNPLPERVTGSDLIYRLAERSAQTKLRLYLYGAAEGVAAKAASELSRLYPGCNIVGVQCPPFRATSDAEVQMQIAQIQQAKPDVLLVALGQPKGEYWIEDHLQRLNVPLSIQVGASFDFVAGNAQRAPKLWQKLGCEWLYRMLKDPKRLAPRYIRNAMYLLRFIHRDCIDWIDSPPKPGPTANPIGR